MVHIKNLKERKKKRLEEVTWDLGKTTQFDM